MYALITATHIMVLTSWFSQKQKMFSSFVKNHPLEVALLVTLMIVASLLRFYHIREAIIFLGDEGRDALVVKRILVDHKLTLLGPTASVGGFYLGPVYYYFMVPFMWLSGLDPVGPAIMVALFSLATIFLLYLVSRRWFGPLPALITSLLYAVSPGITAFSRSSWNPNPMPFFSLLAVTTMHYGSVKKKFWLILLAGICFGISIQLHYLGLMLGPILVALGLLLIEKKRWLRSALMLVIGFFIGSSMFFGFEVRHGFPNTRTIFEFVTRGGSTTGPRSYNLLWLFYEIQRFNWEAILSQRLAAITSVLTIVFFVLLSLSVAIVWKRKTKFPAVWKSTLVFLIIGGFGIGMYRGQLHYHYIEYLFPAPFLALAAILSTLKKNWLKKTSILLALVCAGILIQFSPVWLPASNLVDQTERIADAVITYTDGQDYNFALIAQGNSDHAYRFFLEKKGVRPKVLEEEVTEQLIVVCEQKPEICAPLGHPLWEIAGFGRAEIVEQTIVFPHISIFKLQHHPDSQDLIGKPARQG